MDWNEGVGSVLNLMDLRYDKKLGNWNVLKQLTSSYQKKHKKIFQTCMSLNRQLKQCLLPNLPY